MNILKADPTDLREILDLQYLAYQSEAELLDKPDIPPLQQTLAEVEAEFSRGIILKAVDEDGALIGSVRAYAKEGTLHIGKLIVRPDLQGQGIGTKLMHEIEAACPQKRYELFTGTESVRNIRLYQHLGYTVFREECVSPGLQLVYLEKFADQQLL